MPAAIPQYTGVDRVIGVVGYPKLEREPENWYHFTGLSIQVSIINPDNLDREQLKERIKLYWKEIQDRIFDRIESDKKQKQLKLSRDNLKLSRCIFTHSQILDFTYTLLD